MIRNITKTILATGIFLSFSASSLPISAATKTPTEISQSVSFAKANLKDTESLKTIIKNTFSENIGDLKLESSDEDTLVFSSDNYEVEVTGIDLEKTGINHVSMELTQKDKVSTLPIELPVTAKQTEKEFEPSVKSVMVEVKDVTAPVIEVQDTFTVDQNTDLDLESQIKVSDDLDENVQLNLSEDVDYTKLGSYTVVASASDASGNKTTKEITVNVEENFYDKIANAALAQLGNYQDCTMLVTNSLKAVGINFHGSPAAYLSLGEVTNDPVPGDIIVYSGHVAIYIGNGQAVHGGWLGNQTVVSTVECTNPFIAYVHVSK